MIFVKVNTSTGEVHFLRDNPPLDAGEIVLELSTDIIPGPRKNFRWDGGTGLRAATQQELLTGQLRPFLEIYQAINALTGLQKSKIWDDLNLGTPKKLFLNTGERADILAWAEFFVNQANLGTAPIAEAKLRAATTYVRDNPLYLINPSFDPTINISGYYL